jgi:carbamoyltransferase
MYVLGLSALTHDSSAALVGDGGVVAAIEEGKISRTRAASGIPSEAIRFCLERARISWSDVRHVAVAASFPRRRRPPRMLPPESPLTLGANGHSLEHALDDLAPLLSSGRLPQQSAGHRFQQFDHHLCHAASAFYPSPFDRALILTLDEMGDGKSGLVAIGEGTSISPLRSFSFPNSLGWIFSQVTGLLGFRPHEDEHKTQWLSLTGKPEFADLFLEVLRVGPGATPRLNRQFFHRSSEGITSLSPEFYRRIGIAGPDDDLPESLRANLAASLQQACATVVTGMLRQLRKKHKIPAVCLAGGVFLNPLLVESAERESGFEQVFVQLAAGNEGTALGAAWLVQHQEHGHSRRSEPAFPYWGPGFSNEEIKQVLDNCKATYRWMESEPRKMEEAVRLLLAGRIVAWYQGPTEFGPRALGNRSLLASPWDPYVKENLNDFVKHREAYRPFALSVPEEDCGRYFDCSGLGRFMATMGQVREPARELFAGLILPGNRVRVHIVTRQANLLYWKLLKSFGQRGPAPVLVNTSFNLFGEPLVVTPRDAIRSFYCSGTDALMMGDFLLTKATAQEFPEPGTTGVAGQDERWSRA